MTQSGFAVLCLITSLVIGSTGTYAQRAQDEPVFRDPFSLKLPVDKTHYYEERFDRKIPYVFEKAVYLFHGESFGIKVSTSGDQVTSIYYEKDLSKADVTFEFKQMERKRNSVLTLLVIENKLPRRLYLDALMTVPNRKGVFKTSILPVEAKLQNYESWPHPIVQLVLRNFRFSDSQ
jgi:hypothetical protein